MRGDRPHSNQQVRAWDKRTDPIAYPAIRGSAGRSPCCIARRVFRRYIKSATESAWITHGKRGSGASVCSQFWIVFTGIPESRERSACERVCFSRKILSRFPNMSYAACPQNPGEYSLTIPTNRDTLPVSRVVRVVCTVHSVDHPAHFEQSRNSKGEIVFVDSLSPTKFIEVKQNSSGRTTTSILEFLTPNPELEEWLRQSSTRR